MAKLKNRLYDELKTNKPITTTEPTSSTPATSSTTASKPTTNSAYYQGLEKYYNQQYARNPNFDPQIGSIRSVIPNTADSAYYQGLSDYYKGRQDFDPQAGSIRNVVPNKTPGIDLDTNAKYDVYSKQMELAERIAAQQRQFAQSSLVNKQRALQDQLAQQRRDYSQQLGLISEQSYGQGNKLLSVLSDRGLATSGLLQLGDAQAQMAKAQGLSDLAYQSRIGQTDILREQLASEDYASAQMRQADLDRLAAETDIEEKRLSREDRFRSEGLQAATHIAELQASGEATTEMLNQVLGMYGKYFEETYPEFGFGYDEITGEPKKLTGSLEADLAALGDFANKKFKQTPIWKDISHLAASGALAGAAAGSLFAGVGAGPGALAGGAIGAISGAVTSGTTFNYRLTKGGDILRYNSPQEFIDKELAPVFSKNKDFAAGNVTIKPDKENNIRFYVKGSDAVYEKFDEAVKAYRARADN